MFINYRNEPKTTQKPSPSVAKWTRSSCKKTAEVTKRERWEQKNAGGGAGRRYKSSAKLGEGKLGWLNICLARRVQRLPGEQQRSFPA